MKIKFTKITGGTLALLAIMSIIPLSYASAASNQANAMQFQTRMDSKIDARIAQLNQVIAATNSKNFTDAEKSAIIAAAEANIASLNALRNTAGTSVDQSGMRANMQSVKSVNQYGKLSMSKTRLAARAEVMDTAADRLDDIANTLSRKIAAAQASGKDVSALNSLLAQMQSKLAAATTAYDTVKANMNALSVPQQGTDNASSISEVEQAKVMISAGAQDLKDARTLKKAIVAGLKAMGIH